MSQFSMATVTHWEISSIQINLTKLHLTLISLSLSLSICVCVSLFSCFVIHYLEDQLKIRMQQTADISLLLKISRWMNNVSQTTADK